MATRTIVSEMIGIIPASKGDWVSGTAYAQDNQVKMYNCVLSSKHDNNTTTPMTWDGAETFTFNTEHWDVVMDGTAQFLADKDKPATTGTTGDYPYNGMGRVELAKNMVNTGTDLEPVMVNQLTQDMFYKGAVGSRVPNTNTIFVIRYDYELSENITIPSGCVLQFDGGSISGAYTITGANTILDGDIKLSNVVFAGTFDNNVLNIDNGFTNPDFFGILRCFKKAKVVMKKDITVSTKDITPIGSVNLEGEGHTLTVKTMVFANGSAADVNINNVVFDMTNADPALLWNSDTEGGFIAFAGNNNNVNFHLKNCVFNNADTAVTYLRGCNNVFVADCKINGIVASNDNVPVQASGSPTPGFLVKVGILVYDVRGQISILRNVIYGLHVGLSGFVSGNDNMLIEDNIIEHMDCGCIQLAGGYVNYLTCRGNILKDANVNNVQTKPVWSEAINVHGANNFTFDSNIINSPNATCAIDFEGSGDSGDPVGARGNNLIVSNNSVKNGKGIAFSSLDGLDVHGNDFVLSSAILVNANNVKLRNNNIKCSYIQVNYSGADGISIYDNKIDNSSTHFLGIGSSVTGKVYVGRNEVKTAVYLDSSGSSISFTQDVIDTVIVKVPLGKVTRTPLFSYKSEDAQNFNFFQEIISISAFCLDAVAHYSTGISMSVGRIRSATANFEDTAIVNTTALPSHLTPSRQEFIRPTSNPIIPVNLYDVYAYCNGGTDASLEGVDMFMTLELNKYYHRYV